LLTAFTLKIKNPFFEVNALMPYLQKTGQSSRRGPVLGNLLSEKIILSGSRNHVIFRRPTRWRESMAGFIASGGKAGGPGGNLRQKEGGTMPERPPGKNVPAVSMA
jgi:hypothetical protein